MEQHGFVRADNGADWCKACGLSAGDPIHEVLVDKRPTFKGVPITHVPDLSTPSREQQAAPEAGRGDAKPVWTGQELHDIRELVRAIAGGSKAPDNHRSAENLAHSICDLAEAVVLEMRKRYGSLGVKAFDGLKGIEDTNYVMPTKRVEGVWTCRCGGANESGRVFCAFCGKDRRN